MYEMKICLSNAIDFSHHCNDNAFLNIIMYMKVYIFLNFFLYKVFVFSTPKNTIIYYRFYSINPNKLILAHI